MKTSFGEIADIDIKENGSIFVKILTDGSLIGSNVPESMSQTELEEAMSVNPQELRFKLLKANEYADSSIKASEKYSSLIGDSNTRITSTSKFGNFIIGPTTFSAHPENIRIGGVYRLNGLMTSTMPSTIITPIPTLVFDFPLEDTIKNIASLVSDFEQYITGLL